MDHIAEFPDYYSNKKYGTIASEKGLEKVHENKSNYTIKDDVERILKTIKTAKPQHKETLTNMVTNLENKYKKEYGGQEKFIELINKLHKKISDKFGMEEDYGASVGAYVGPLEVRENKIIKVKDLLSEISDTKLTRLRDSGGTMDGNSWVGEKDKDWYFKNKPAWSDGEIVYMLSKLDINWVDGDLTVDTIKEGWLFKTEEDKVVLNILKRVEEEFPTDAEIKYRRVFFSLPGVERPVRIEVMYGRSDYGDTIAWLEVNGKLLEASDWAIKKLFKYMYNILDDKRSEEKLRRIQADLTDPDYAQDVFDQLGDINEAKKKDPSIHTAKWKRCFEKVSKKEDDETAAAICTKSIGYEGSIKKKHRKKEDIEETTTFASALGDSGTYVTPAFAAPKGKHGPSKKPIWKGGTIVQKINNSGVMVENSLGEVNDIKYVKGGKFVKIKDKCAKYRNNEHCNQGAIDNPLELSDTTFKNISEVAKKTGLSEKVILEKIKKKITEDKKFKLSWKDRVKIKMAGISDDQVIYNLNNGLPIDWKGTKEGYYQKHGEGNKGYSGSD
jgi:hypothetical protein